MTIRQVVDITVKAGLSAIEWGGDFHVPHGDLKAARRAKQVTADAGLIVSSYGSYYKTGENEPAFETVLETAVEMGAPSVRVWAGTRGSDIADETYRNKVVEDSRRVGDLAESAGLDISYEFHGGTLTDTNHSALDLLRAVSHKAVKTYWQPAIGKKIEYRLAGLKSILPWLSNIHIFHWGDKPEDRRPLNNGSAEWIRYLECVSSTGRNHFALLEFVQNDDPQALIRDAGVLKRLEI